MYSTYGASLRSMFQYSNPGSYEDGLDEEVDKLSFQELTNLLSPNPARTHSHFLITTRPSQTNRALPNVKVASRYVLRKVCDKLFQAQPYELQMFYKALRSDPRMASTTSTLFGYRVHWLLQRKDNIEIFPIKGHADSLNAIYNDYTATNKGKPKKIVQLPSLSEAYIQGTPEPVQVGRYYRPLDPKFPSFDSWLLTEAAPRNPPIFLKFQVTLNKTQCEVKGSGLDILEPLVDPKIKRYVVVVTPEGITPDITVLSLQPGQGQNVNTIFPVYHLPVPEEVLFG